MTPEFRDPTLGWIRDGFLDGCFFLTKAFTCWRSHDVGDRRRHGEWPYVEQWQPIGHNGLSNKNPEISMNKVALEFFV